MENKFKKIIPVLILFFLIFRFQVASFRLGYELSFLYFSSIVFSIFLFKNKYIYPALFLLLCTFSSYYPLCTLTSINSLRIIFVGIFTYYFMCEIGIDKDCFLNILSVVCIIHVLFIIAQYFKFDPYLIYGIRTNMEITGLTANPNEASALIALCTPAFFRKRVWVLIPLLLLGLFLAKSFGGILSFSLIIAAFFLLRGNKFTGGLLCLSIILTAYFFIHNPNISHRLSVWVTAIKLYFNENLFFGFGLGHWQYISKNYLSESYNGVYFQRAHNTFLQCWFELGFGFLVILVGYGYDIIKKAISDKILIFALIAIFISCSVNSAFRINALNGLIILVWLSVITNNRRVRDV